MPDPFNPVYCRGCHLPIENDAAVCPQCGRDQTGAVPLDPPAAPDAGAHSVIAAAPPSATAKCSRAGSHGLVGCMAGGVTGLLLGCTASVLLLALALFMLMKGCVNSVHDEVDKAGHTLTNK